MGTYQSKARQLAKRLGAILTGNATSEHGLEAKAPAGYTWKCDPGLHVLVSAPWDDDYDHPDTVWQDLWERMDMGVEPCDCCPECTQARAEKGGPK